MLKQTPISINIFSGSQNWSRATRRRRPRAKCIPVVRMYKMNLGCRTLNLPTRDSLQIVVQLTVKASAKLGFRDLIIKRGYSERAVDELWKWYDFSEKKGVASF